MTSLACNGSGLGQNVLKVPAGLDVGIPPSSDKRGYGTCAPRLLSKKLSCCMPQAIIKFHKCYHALMNDHCGCVILYI
jgi:hypothetical protein